LRHWPPRLLQPLLERVGGAEVGPLGEVGLAEQDRAGLAQPRGDEGVPGGDRPFEGERAGGGGHPVGGADVVLDQDRDAVERSAGALAAPLGVERVGDGERLRVDFDHRPQLRPFGVQGVDAGQILLGERARRLLARGESSLKLGDRGFLELEGSRSGGGGRSRRGGCWGEQGLSRGQGPGGKAGLHQGAPGPGTGGGIVVLFLHGFLLA
jgi:hypothetical protein